MRNETVFRGVPIGGDKNQWVYGAFHKYLPYTPGIDQEPEDSEYQYLIIQDGSSDWNTPRQLRAIQVYPESVGMCSEIRDEHGAKIYEGDIIRYQSRILGVVGDRTVKYQNGEFITCGKRGEIDTPLIDFLGRNMVEVTERVLFDQYWNDENNCYEFSVQK